MNSQLRFDLFLESGFSGTRVENGTTEISANCHNFLVFGGSVGVIKSAWIGGLVPGSCDEGILCVDLFTFTFASPVQSFQISYCDIVNFVLLIFLDHHKLATSLTDNNFCPVL